MREITNADRLAHTMALAQPTSEREIRLRMLEDRIKSLADRHRHTDSVKQIADAINTIKEELTGLPRTSPILPQLMMEELSEELKVRHVPQRRLNLQD